MAYIGTKPTIGNFQICDAISVVNGQAAYTMQVGSVNVIPESSLNMIVSLNGTIQKGGGTNPSYTVSGSTITFSSNLATGDVIDFILILGDVLSIGTPSDNVISTAKIVNDAVTTSKIADDAVTLGKMASGTDGNIISYDASGNPVAIATGNDGQVLTSTGAGSPPAFETLPSSNPYTAISKAESGYITLVGGLIIQWGLWGTFGGTVSTGSVSFPITFPSDCYTITTGLLNGNSTALSSLIIDNGGPSTSGFSWYQADSGQSSRLGGYIAIGV